MKNLSDCRVLLVDDAKANLDILIEGLKADHKLSIIPSVTEIGRVRADLDAQGRFTVKGVQAYSVVIF